MNSTLGADCLGYLNAADAHGHASFKIKTAVNKAVHSRNQCDFAPRFGGTPKQISEVDLPTHRDCIRHFYYLRDLHPRNMPYGDIATKVADDIMKVWKKANSSLPLKSHNCVFKRISRLTATLKCISRKGKSAAQKKNMLIPKLDKLMDISICNCSLESVECSDSQVNCRVENCAVDHVLCTCNPPVPDNNDRIYLRAERKKVQFLYFFLLEILKLSLAFSLKKYFFIYGPLMSLFEG